MVCCAELKAHRNVASPFVMVYMDDYYDGIISGFAQCSLCHQSFMFRLITWDSHLWNRIFALFEISQSEFEALIEIEQSLINKYGSPQALGCWGDPKRRPLDERIEGMMNSTSEPVLIAVAEHLDETIKEAFVPSDAQIEQILKMRGEKWSRDAGPPKGDYAEWTGLPDGAGLPSRSEEGLDRYE